MHDFSLAKLEIRIQLIPSLHKVDMISSPIKFAALVKWLGIFDAGDFWNPPNLRYIYLFRTYFFRRDLTQIYNIGVFGQWCDSYPLAFSNLMIFGRILKPNHLKSHFYLLELSNFLSIFWLSNQKKDLEIPPIG